MGFGLLGLGFGLLGLGFGHWGREMKSSKMEMDEVMRVDFQFFLPFKMQCSSPIFSVLSTYNCRLPTL